VDRQRVTCPSSDGPGRSAAADTGRAPGPLAPGQVLAGRFRVTEGPRGPGGAALGEMVEGGASIALRLIPVPRGGDRLADRWADHARLVERLAGANPSIATVVECGTLADGTLLLVTARPAGVPLGHLMQEKKALDVRRSVALTLSIAQALEAAHNLGVVHGSLSPENILVGRGDAVTLVDFGFDRMGPSVGPMAGAGRDEVPAWLKFQAPEQARSGSVTERSDVYALGALLYAMLTGQPPAAASPVVWYPAPASPIPDSLRQVISRALQEEPSRRLADVTELVNQLWMEMSSLAGGRGPDAVPSDRRAGPRQPASSVQSPNGEPRARTLHGRLRRLRRRVTPPAQPGEGPSPPVGESDGAPFRPWRRGALAAGLSAAGVLAAALVWLASERAVQGDARGWSVSPALTHSQAPPAVSARPPGPATGSDASGSTAGRATPSAGRPELPQPAPSPAAAPTPSPIAGAATRAPVDSAGKVDAPTESGQATSAGSGESRAARAAPEASPQVLSPTAPVPEPRLIDVPRSISGASRTPTPRPPATLTGNPVRLEPPRSARPVPGTPSPRDAPDPPRRGSGLSPVPAAQAASGARGTAAIAAPPAPAPAAPQPERRREPEDPGAIIDWLLKEGPSGAASSLPGR
jgi:hypothetical protein